MSLRTFIERFVVLEPKGNQVPEPPPAAGFQGRPADQAERAPVTPATVTKNGAAATPSGPATAAPAHEAPAVAAAPDFAAIYQDAEIAAAPITAEQALNTLAALPPGVPQDAQRQALKALLQSMGKALGTSAQAVAEDAARKIAALTAHVNENAQEEAAFSAAVEQEIGELQERIAEKRRSIEATRIHERQIKQTCEEEANRLRIVLQVLGGDKR